MAEHETAATASPCQGWRSYIPASVLLLGILSVAMLFWADHVNQRQRIQFGLVDTLEDLRVHVSTAHLWLEEAITYSAEEIDLTWSDLERARHLADLLLTGGQTERGVQLPPLREPGLHMQAAELKRDL